MIRARKNPRSDSCCISADVLTPTERAASRLPTLPAVPAHRQGIRWEAGMRWGDVPEIRAILSLLMSKQPEADYEHMKGETPCTSES